MRQTSRFSVGTDAIPKFFSFAKITPPLLFRPFLNSRTDSGPRRIVTSHRPH